LLKDPQTYSEAHPRDPDDSCTDAETIVIEVKQGGTSRRFGFSCQTMGRLGEALDLVLQTPAQTPSATGPLQRRYPADAGSSTIRLFSEGYLQWVGAKETTALKGSDGVWRIATVTGVPGNWSRPRYSRLGQAQAKALEAILESPGSYFYDPGPDPSGVCLDPWSNSVDWSWKGKTYSTLQLCGPWGVLAKVAEILDPSRR
jgi:hypothetical protein